MTPYTSLKDYTAYLEKIGELPRGFRVGTRRISFFPRERPVKEPLPMTLTLVVLDELTDLFGGVFTRNAFPGAPVIIGRKRLNSRTVRGILINNKVSNVGAPRGTEDAEEILFSLGSLTGAGADAFFPASTGIIGWSLPKDDMMAALPGLVDSLHRGSCADAARAIMTTDSYPKLRSVEVRGGRLVGFAKGAGMIEPNLATMLVFLLTDFKIPREVLRRALSRTAEETFNCISVDGDQSTSDTVLLLSSGEGPEISEAEFEAALKEVCSGLARDIVRNGEGTGHVIKVRVSEARSFEVARAFGKAVVNSPLVKTAVFGNDPNVGRIVSALGDYAGNAGIEFQKEKILISLGEEVIFQAGSFRLDRDKEERLSSSLSFSGMDTKEKPYPPHDRTVDIDIRLGEGNSEAVVYGSDLSYDYVRENADYRS
jgi:glutamate N-acetyltransferase/amino-acid N-acetyltransferase